MSPPISGTNDYFPLEHEKQHANDCISRLRPSLLSLQLCQLRLRNSVSLPTTMAMKPALRIMASLWVKCLAAFPIYTARLSLPSYSRCSFDLTA